MIRPLLDLLAPVRCLSCRRRGPQPWCRDCAPSPMDVTATCRRCGAAVDTVVPDDGGPACPLVDGPVAELVAAHAYRGAVAEAVRTAKLSGCTAAYPGMAAEIAEAIRRRGMALPDVVTGVPVPRRRRRRRGFDHGALLAAGVGQRLDRPVATLLEVVHAAADRGASRVRPGRVSSMAVRRRVTGEVLVVDDVVTTGATARVAAQALLAGGAEQVRVAALARAGHHDGPRRAARRALARARG